MALFDPTLIRPLAGIFLLSIALPAAIFLGRNHIRGHRQELVRGLTALFKEATDHHGKPLIIPSVELVRYKYDPSARHDYKGNEGSRIKEALLYAPPVLVYVSLTFLGCLLAFVGPHVSHALSPFVQGGIAIDDFNPQMKASFYATMTYTFLGAYIWTIFFLVKRVSNFDLSPLSFLRAATHLLFALFVAATLWHFAGAEHWQRWGTSTIGLAFLIGFAPDLAFRAISAKYPWMKLRRVSPASRALCEEIPLDCIVGIDPFIKFRLADFEIEDVQNLATVNPIQLFVESPYNLFEVIDWVAQAQLILAVGPERTLRLRRFNIRSVLDLEAVVESKALTRLVLGALLGDHRSDAPLRRDSEKVPAGASPVVWNHEPSPKPGAPSAEAELLAALVHIMTDNLHVHRLRQLRDVLTTQLDRRPHEFFAKRDRHRLRLVGNWSVAGNLACGATRREDHRRRSDQPQAAVAAALVATPAGTRTSA